MKTRTRLVVEIVALVAAAALFAVVYRLRYYGYVFEKKNLHILCTIAAGS